MRGWLRFGVRDRLARLVHNPDTAESESFEVPFFGMTYRGDYSSFIDWSVFYFGAYAKPELDLLGRLLEVRPGPCLDIGANVGHHTLFLATRSPSVIAFEPAASLAAQIRTHLQDNGLENVDVVECGLGARREDLPFFASTDHNQGTGTFVPGVYPRESTTIQVAPGDELLAARGDPLIVLAKVDVEGFEREVLRGLGRTIERSRPLVFFEWSHLTARRGGSEEPSELFPSDYSLYRFQPEVHRLGVFATGQFAIQPWRRGSVIDGNLLAVPSEDVSRIEAIAMTGKARLARSCAIQAASIRPDPQSGPESRSDGSGSFQRL
jgi:FkbM family methyltransferase